MMGQEIHRGFQSPALIEDMESLALSDAPSDYGIAVSSSIAASGDPLLTSSSSSAAFLDPPSYADVVFSPFDAQNGVISSAGKVDVGDNSPSLSSPLAHGFSSPRVARVAVSDYLKIVISDPQKESLVSGGTAYDIYLVTSRVRGSPSEVSVRCRFRDVMTLTDRLVEAYRGYFVPSRPDKNVVESQVMLIPSKRLPKGPTSTKAQIIKL